MKNKTIIKEWATTFFGNKFALRALVWTSAFIMFAFGLAFIISSRVGYATYDALWTPIRIIFNVSDPTKYGVYFLIPSGLILTIINLIIHYIRTKKVRVDYVLGAVPVIFTGFILDAILKFNFFQTLLVHKTNVDWPFIEYPLVILWACIGVPLFGFGIGIMSGTRLMPNVFAILVAETSIITKKSFKKIQLFYDLTFVLLGVGITIINIYAKKIDAGTTLSWPYAMHYIGPLTFIILLSQGYMIGHSMHFVEKKFGY